MTRSAVTRIALLTSVATIAVTGYLVSVDSAPVKAAALAQFDACDDALGYLKSEALARVGPYGLDGGVQLYDFDGARGAAEDTAASGPAQAAGTAPGVAPVAPGHSTTNVQEVGVDEPDIVKTDGEHIFSVVDGTLRVIDVASDSEVGHLDLTPAATEPDSQDYPEMVGSAELLLDGDRVMVLVRQPMMWLDEPRAMPGWTTWQGSRLLTVDVSDPANPTQVAALDLDGDIVSARLVDGIVRVAVRTQPALEFPWEEALANDEPALTARNREIIEKSELVDWLPSAVWSSGGTSEENLLVPCDRLSYPTEFSGFTTVSVLSLPIGGDLREPSGTGVLGSGDTVYASTDRFYVATNGWTATVIPIDGGPGIVSDFGIGAVAPGGGALVAPDPAYQRTGIHAFDITAAGPARYVGSGTVDGRLIGQYALSEWEGNLRVASTTGDMWASGEQSRSRVTVLAEDGGDLVEIGMVDGLGEGEQIYAVRYVGATAYVVTFEQTDPLYVLDLADPTAPTVRGELKITGYSAYLHPVGDGRVVGVGQEAKVTGQTIGAQVSLFDVSDPSAPTKLAGHVVRNGWSEAEYEARAFLYWAPTGQLVIPMGTNNRAGALVLEVGTDTLTEVGWVTAPTQSQASGNGESVRRSLVIGDQLFTVWSDGIQGSDLDTLDELTWIPFS